MSLIDQFGAEQPTNVTPPDQATDVSVTPYLAGSAFVTDLIIEEIDDPGSLDMVVSLSVSRDGVVFGPEISRSLGEFGHYEQRVQWADPGGLGRYESFMGMRVRTTAPIEFSPDSLVVDVSNVNR